MKSKELYFGYGVKILDGAYKDRYGIVLGKISRHMYMVKIAHINKIAPIKRSFLEDKGNIVVKYHGAESEYRIKDDDLMVI